MRSARPTEKLVSEPSQSDRIRPTEQSSKMKVGESFSRPVHPKQLPGHQNASAAVPEMTGAVFFHLQRRRRWCMVLLTQWMEGR